MITDQACWSKVTPSAAMQIISKGYTKVIAETATYHIVECGNCFIKIVYTPATLKCNSQLNYFKQDK